MPHDDGRDASSGGSIVPVHITPANTAGFDPHQHLVCASLRLGHIVKSKFIVGRQSQSFHPDEWSLVFGHLSNPTLP
jgi:hypothetical protein